MQTNKKIDTTAFTGTENYYKHFSGMLYTDGVKYIADQGNAYWLIDLVASYQNAKMRAEEFQVYALQLDGKGGCRITITDGNDNTLAEQAIEYTDFPQDIDLWLIRESEEVAVLILPTEY